jgi:hypothetical protein
VAHIQDQNLAEVVDLADVAVRTASQLRIAKSGHGVSDPSALDQSLDFLESAQQGGAFMSKKISQLAGTLRPLNWAADAYLSLNTGPQGAPDYGKVESYLRDLSDSIRNLMQGSADVQNLDKALVFFETLGEILGSLADQRLRRELSKRPFEL